MFLWRNLNPTALAAAAAALTRAKPVDKPVTAPAAKGGDGSDTASGGIAKN